MLVWHRMALGVGQFSASQTQPQTTHHRGLGTFLVQRGLQGERRYSTKPRYSPDRR